MERRVRHRQPKGTVTDGPLLYTTAPTLDPTVDQQVAKMFFEHRDSAADRVDALEVSRLDAPFHVNVEERRDIADLRADVRRTPRRPLRIAAGFDLGCERRSVAR
jgi:hypothetical protein